MSGATTPGQGRPGSNGNEEILVGGGGGGGLPSTEMLSVYHTAPADWAMRKIEHLLKKIWK